MAIFGNNTKEKKGVLATGRGTKHRARTAMNTDGSSHDIIRAPWLSEKSLILTEKGVYAFEVSPRATKAEIAGAIKEIYNVEPRKLRIMNIYGKPKAMRTKRGVGHRSSRRKVYVYLNTGDTIQFA